MYLYRCTARPLHCARAATVATAYCTVLRDSQRESLVLFCSSYTNHPQLATLLFSRPLSCPPLLRASSCGSCLISSVCALVLFAPGRCSLSPIEPDLFAPCLLCSALLCFACIVSLLVLVLVLDSCVQNLLMRVCEQSLLESLPHTPGTARQGQLLCDSCRI